jgi:Uncharacterized conserved protein (DUF2278)
MPMDHYGVAIGDLIRFYRDPPNNFGRWFHGHVEISTPSGTWTSALDVDTPTGLGISYRLSGDLTPADLGPVASLPNGFHLLPSSPASGAIDYLRSGFLQDNFLWFLKATAVGLPRTPQPLPPRSPHATAMKPKLSVHEDLLQKFLNSVHQFDYWLPKAIPLHIRPWLRSDGNNALTALDAELIENRKVYLFGERFNTGQGVHNVHQNQGDPAGSQWWNENGIWQDGAVGVQREDATLFIWQVRFNSQATKTDNAGHPL